MLLYFSDAYAMHLKHEFSLDDVFGRTKSFSVLNDGVAVVIGVDEVGDVRTGTFDEFGLSAFDVLVLWRYELVGDLLPKVGDESGTLHEIELCGTVVLFL